MRVGRVTAQLAITTSLLAIASPLYAQSNEYDVAAGTVKSALDSYSRQSGRPVVYKIADVRGKSSKGYRGAASADQALDGILSGTGLRAQNGESNSVAIVRSYGESSQGELHAAEAAPATEGIDSASQPDHTGSGVFSDIIVTAQKREQNLQDVSVAVTALSGDQMRELGMTNSTDIAQMTPNFSFQGIQPNDWVVLPTVRGVSQNDFSVHQEMPNAVYVNEVYISSPAAISFGLFDMERVEVLRGPQGTLFGRNATGGLVNFITRKPTKDLGGFIDITAGSYNEVRVEGAVNLPVSEALQLRVSALHHQHDGWLENMAGKDYFEKEFNGVRAQIRLAPNEDIENIVTITAGKNPRSLQGTYAEHRVGFVNDQGLGVNLPRDSAINGCPGCDSAGFADGDVDDIHRGAYNEVGYMSRRSFQATNRFSWNFGGATLTALSDYQDFKLRANEDCDGTIGELCEFPNNQDSRQLSQEIKLNGKAGSLVWTAGFYYIDIKSRMTTDYLASVAEFFSFNDLHLRTKSWALFGQLEYPITDQFTLIGGFRWTEDKKVINQTTDVEFQGVSSPTFVFNRDTVGDLAVEKSGDYSFKAAVEWRPAPKTLFYASVSRGNKGGGFNAASGGAFADLEKVRFKPEVLTSYEVGTKLTLLDRLLRFNAAAFYYDYNDYQAQDLFNFQTLVGNYDGRYYGGEAEMVLTPGSGWDIALGASYLNAVIYDVNLAGGSSGPITIDRDPPRAPKFTANGLVRKEWPAFGGSMAVQADFKYSSSSYAGISNAPALKLDSYLVANARITFTGADDNWDISAFVNNLTDEEVPIMAYDTVGSSGYNLRAYGPPRWYGVRVGLRF